jgi:S1-C subfamily serine protease
MYRLTVRTLLLLLTLQLFVITSPAPLMAAGSPLTTSFYSLASDDENAVEIPTLLPNIAANERDNTRYQPDSGCITLRNSVSPSIVKIQIREISSKEFRRSGTGFIVRADGLIATCQHELPGYLGSVRVVVADGRTYDVDIVLEDKPNDIALLKIKQPDGQTFPALAMGSSQTLVSRSDLTVFGYPRNWDRVFMSPGVFLGTVTAGIKYSGKKPITYMDPTRSMLLLYMHCEPGNSGSPLVDQAGHVVGIVESVSNNKTMTEATPVDLLIKDMNAL